MPGATSIRPEGDATAVRRQLLAVVDRLAREVDPRARGRHRLTPDSRLDRDLGLDSLARAELILRIEQAFGVELPEEAINADTPRALEQLLRSSPVGGAARRAPEMHLVAEAVWRNPDEVTTLNDVLEWHVRAHPDRNHAYLLGTGDQAESLSYRQLHAGARCVAAGLQARGIVPGKSVAIMLPTGRDYLLTFFGALYAGAVPVPIYPPSRASQLEEHLRRHGRILANAEAALLVTVREARSLARLLHAEAPGLRDFVTVEELTDHGLEIDSLSATSDSLALLQYTSGSTGDPKGVMLTHADLLANIRVMGQRLEVTSSDVVVSWLPLYHDMGLIGAWLGSLYYSVPLVLMSPLAFLSHPVRWLQVIHQYRGTISGGPNFGFELCLRALEAQPPAGLDLACWRVAFNGAEPVSPETLERFSRTLAPVGFRAEALTPVYGLAEAGVGLCIPSPGRGALIDRVDREIFNRTGRAQPPDTASRAISAFVNCGPPLADYEIRILDEGGREQPERQEGHIEFRGPSATRGYFRRPELSRELFDGEWLRTGDRGYLAGGGIHVTGRVKDVIVRGGRNVYPYELEAAIGGIPGVRKGCVAAFGDPDPDSGIERLVVVAETREDRPAERRRLVDAIRSATVEAVNIPADDIRLVPPHSVLKTSSGKIRRSATREFYRTGRLGQRASALRWQIARLTLRSIANHARSRIRQTVSLLYAGYAWILFGVATAVAGTFVLLLPRLEWRWALCHFVARWAAKISGVHIDRRGWDNLPDEEPFVLVANHASYLDAFLVAAVIPRGLRYLAKSELSRRPLAGLLLRRFGVLFVERFDPGRATEDSRRVFSAVAAGDSLAFFPEGTFTRGAGLGAFRMGAFVAAARGHVPVVPMAMQGTRSILRGTEWFPRPGRVVVSIGEPIRPGGESWADAIRLRDEARAFILENCGEPDAMHG
ncbi:MAG: AMP-binding protein [Gammaproteobacteria bacterium]|jgi:1-acyl-sn-glycerol-3-phosphate acyltransferase